MNSYSLELTSIPTFSKKKPKQIVVLCHGYGGDGKDIARLQLDGKDFYLTQYFYVQMLQKFAQLILKDINGLIFHLIKKKYFLKNL